MNPNRRAISLAEVLAVLAIIATISVLAVPHCFVGEASKVESSRLLDQDMLQTAIELYQLDHDGVMPGTSRPLGSDLSPYLPSDSLSADRTLLFGLPVDRISPDTSLSNRAPGIQPSWQYDIESGAISLSSSQ